MESQRRLRIRATTVAAIAVLAFPIVLLEEVSSKIARILPRYTPVLLKLPGHPADDGDPTYIHQSSRGSDLDVAAVRRAGELVPAGSRYFVPGKDRQAGDLELAARLFVRGMPVPRPDIAEWIILYRRRALPPGVRAGATIRVSPELVLVRVAAEP
jgi:hypothetical protein